MPPGSSASPNRDSLPAADRLLHRLRDLGDGKLVVLTGAGISLASGIATFRGTDAGAVWKHDVLELGTFGFFRRDPVTSWRWYLERFAGVLDAEPNAAHHALVELERWHVGRGGEFELITQNVDLLHRKAGSRALVEVHGRADRVRGPADGCRFGAPRGSLPRADFDMTRFRETADATALPRCPACGSILRQHVLWFDEYYAEHDDFGWDSVQQAAATMDLLVAVGTSFSVGVTELFLQAATYRGVPVISIDPGNTPPPYGQVEVLAAPAEELLPATVARLGG